MADAVPRSGAPAPRGVTQVRPRVEADLVHCLRLAQVVHRVDGYPPHLPGDLQAFLASPDALGAWVAVVADQVSGHVALHRMSSEPVMALAAEATGVPPARLAVVARLLVEPGARRAGIGATLLAHAADEARRRGLRPVLDVATHLGRAVALYESRGWTRAGTVQVHFGDGTSIEEHVYLGPDRRR